LDLKHVKVKSKFYFDLLNPVNPPGPKQIF
jgi:hypothetical protein